MRVRRRRDGLVTLRLELDEAYVLRMIPERLREILEDPSSDEAVAGALFPVAFRDAEQEAEYRRLLGDELRQRKLECVDGFEASLRTARVRGGEFELRLDPEGYEYWLGFLNDFRLMLGAQLGIEEDDWGSALSAGPVSQDLALLHLLSYLQEALLQHSGYDVPDLDPDDLRPDDPDDPGAAL